MKAVAEVIGVSRSNLIERLRGPAEEATWSATTTERPARGRDQGGQLPNCRPAATGGSTPSSSGRRQQLA
jgi:hypothetical protein